MIYNLRVSFLINKQSIPSIGVFTCLFLQRLQSLARALHRLVRIHFPRLYARKNYAAPPLRWWIEMLIVWISFSAWRSASTANGMHSSSLQPTQTIRTPCLTASLLSMPLKLVHAKIYGKRILRSPSNMGCANLMRRTADLVVLHTQRVTSVRL